MATAYNYPTALHLEQITQEVLPQLMKDREIFKHMPLTEADATHVAWEQLDNFKGLQQLRGFQGEVQPVAKSARWRYVMSPGSFGEFESIKDEELLEMRQLGNQGNNAAIDITTLVLEASNKLQQRFLDRVENSLWASLGGTYSISTQRGDVTQTDSWAVQSFTSSVLWSTSATSTPYADFRAVKLKGWGHGVQFDQRAVAIMNSQTLNYMLENANASDLFGRRRVNSFGPVDSADDFNKIANDAGLPNILEYSNGYIDQSNVFHPFVPNGKVIVIGYRPGGQLVGDYVMTRNAENPNLEPGQYSRVIDTLHTTGRPPRQIEVHNGHNGGPRIKYPSAVVYMNVA